MDVFKIGEWLVSLPLWILAPLLLALMIGAAYVGQRLRRRQDIAEDESFSARIGFIVSAVFGLEALLVGFTFSLAVDRYETRRVLVLHEANAIHRGFVQTQLLDQPYRTENSRIITAYTDNRIALAQAKDDAVAPLLAENDRLLTALWRDTMAAFPAIKGLDFSSTYVESMTQILEFAAARKAARMARVPPTVFMVLFIYIIASAGVLGYVLIGKHGRSAGGALILLIGLSLILIIDIDRPTSGLIQESQRPMLDMRERLNADYGTPP